MASLEDVFHGAQLALHVPDQPVALTDTLVLAGDDVLDQLQRSTQRDQAFFDERLCSFLALTVSNLDATAATPPPVLLQFLSHLAVTLDASYVGRTQAPEARDTKPQTRLTLPPHLTGNARHKPPAPAKDSHPSIFPPATPNPVPFTDEGDRGYSQADTGVPLYSYAWGDGPPDDNLAFALLRCQRHSAWVALYRLDVSVAFVRNIMRDAQLCLTVSTTLRDRPLAFAPQRKALLDFIKSHGVNVEDKDPSGDVAPAAHPVDDDPALDDFEEINLLEGLGPAGLDLQLPSTRIGPSLRQESYALPTRPALPPTTTSTPTAVRELPTLRKAYRKTLAAVSGFAVKMRSVHSPAVVIPGDVEDELELREIGSEERTIVLCVELENTGESKLGFQVDSIGVQVSGEGARAKLIAWGERAFDEPESVFPLQVGAREQFNLLYAVSFLRPTDGQETAPHAPNRPPGDPMLRYVSIAIKGRPFETRGEGSELLYPTPPFVTRWSCSVSLLAGSSSDRPSSPFGGQDALPAPPSPFPTSSPRTHRPPDDTPTGPKVQSPATFSFSPRRNTLGAPSGTPELKLGIRPMSMPFIHGSPRSPRPETPPTSKFLPAPPNIAFQPSSSPGSPLPSPGLPQTPRAGDSFFPPQHPGFSPQQGPPPQTPAYPAYGDAPHPSTPRALSPMAASGSGYIGPSIEARRERGPTTLGLGLPLSPLPMSPGVRGAHQFFPPQTPLEQRAVEPIVVSIGLVTPGKSGKIYALREPFYLDVFVFNQSSTTRRLELSHPEPTRRRHNTLNQRASMDSTVQVDSETNKGPGLLPLENRIRIGPLRPHASQSVRFPFIALQPGVHAISALSLTDIETRYTINMRSIMDIVVHEASAE
ncbi:hypothetical protein EXIGLDRAFT_665742 [Exidia glandulosa HHB12029]|uniref:Trafficking protein particle complex II-specific subunit 65 IgD3 domain-containing protein n=1 Tax=Exidia glandulosa HHB12029 TaxID=1314781 RepID=A0A165PD80_EXIGL|nr:hypothetical protein EXIGLDRAFT_665742 [Exidia glandulosa HHB12029]